MGVLRPGRIDAYGAPLLSLIHARLYRRACTSCPPLVICCWRQSHADDPVYSAAVADILYNLHRVQFDTGVSTPPQPLSLPFSHAPRSSLSPLSPFSPLSPSPSRVCLYRLHPVPVTSHTGLSWRHLLTLHPCALIGTSVCLLCAFCLLQIHHLGTARHNYGVLNFPLLDRFVNGASACTHPGGGRRADLLTVCCCWRAGAHFFQDSLRVHGHTLLKGGRMGVAVAWCFPRVNVRGDARATGVVLSF